MKNVALITGASGGIGYELAHEFARNKHDLVLVARSGDKLKALAAALSTKFQTTCKVIIKDLRVASSSQEIFDELKNDKIEINYLVNNAGFGNFGFFCESSWKKEEEMIQLNVVSLVHLTKLFLPEMIERKLGKILNVASTAAFQPGPTMAVYFASKAFVLSFSEALANEVLDTGVSVTALCPGATATGFRAASRIKETATNKKSSTAKDVAIFGYRAMMQGKTVAIPGLMNSLAAELVKFMPRATAANLVRKRYQTAE